MSPNIQGKQNNRFCLLCLYCLSGANQGQRTRLLLKVLAISDVVIYRTHADRLHDDLFKFLGDASEAYMKHFTRELKATTTRCGLDVPLSTLGPAVIIFHETVHTKLLGSGTLDLLTTDNFLKCPFRKNCKTSFEVILSLHPIWSSIVLHM